MPCTVNAMPQNDDDRKSNNQQATDPWYASTKGRWTHPVVGKHVQPPKLALDPSRYKFPPMMAWDWLLANASHVPRNVVVGGRPVRLARGQLVASYRFLSQEFNWRPKSVRGWLAKLARHDMITISVSEACPPRVRTAPEQGTGITIITLSNYGKYQFGEFEKGTARAQQGHSKGTARARSKQLNNDTKEEDDDDTAETEFSAEIVDLDNHKLARIISADSYETFHALCESFCAKSVVAVSKAKADSVLARIVRAHLRHSDVDDARLVLEDALTAAFAKDVEAHASKTLGTNSITRIQSYLSSVLADKVPKRATQKARAIARHETARVRAERDAESVLQGGKRRAGVRSYEELGEELARTGTEDEPL